MTKSPRTVNNALAVLTVLLKKAVEWGVIERMPCTIRRLKVEKWAATFHDSDQYERLVDAARTEDRIAELVVLLGGEAGLRCGRDRPRRTGRPLGARCDAALHAPEPRRTRRGDSVAGRPWQPAGNASHRNGRSVKMLGKLQEGWR